MIEYRFVDRPFEEAMKMICELYEEDRRFVLENWKEVMYLFLHEKEHERIMRRIRNYASYNGRNSFGEHVFWFEFDAVVVYLDVELGFDCFDWQKKVVFIEKGKLPDYVIGAIREYFEDKDGYLVR